MDSSFQQFKNTFSTSLQSPNNQSFSSTTKNLHPNKSNHKNHYLHYSIQSPKHNSLTTRSLFRQNNPESVYSSIHQHSSSMSKIQTFNDRFKENSRSELQNFILIYESQIQKVKKELHSHNVVDKKRIETILNMYSPNFAYEPENESKIVLKQLKSKVATLLSQNNDLKSNLVRSQKRRTQPIVYDYHHDDLLVRENERLRNIIDVYKKGQEQMLTSKKQNGKLKEQNEWLNERNTKLVSKIVEMEQNKSQGWMNHKKRGSSFGDQNQKQTIKIIQQIRPIKTEFNSYLLSKDDIDYAKKQLTKQMFNLQQEVGAKFKNHQLTILELNRKVQCLQKKVKQYEKLKNMKVQSIIRKSFDLTKNMRMLEGDKDGDFYGLLSLEQKKEGRPNQPNIFKNKNYEKFHPNEKERIEDGLQYKIGPQGINQVLTLQNELKEVKEQVVIKQAKTKNILQENQKLKKKLLEMERKLKEKIDGNLKLHGIIEQLQNTLSQTYSQTSKSNRTGILYPQIEEEVRIIRETLHSCNVSNFEVFFKEFNEILQQRRMLTNTIQGYKSVSRNKQLLQQKDKVQRQTLENKVFQLKHQNKMLLNRIAEMEAEFRKSIDDSFHTQIDRLNQIRSNEMLVPNGEIRVEWQKVKDSIETSVVKLVKLEQKLGADKREDITKSQ